MYGDSKWQNAADWITPATFSASGRSSTTSQLSVIVLPVLTPPCSVRPFLSRASRLKSTPFQCCCCLPYWSALNTTLLAVGLKFWSKRPPSEPLVPRRGSDGIVAEYSVKSVRASARLSVAQKLPP